MDQIPIQYIINLDKSYNDIIIKIKSDIDNFNSYLYDFIIKNYNHGETDHHDGNKQPDKPDDTSSPKKYDQYNFKKDSLIVFNFNKPYYETETFNNLINGYNKYIEKDILKENDLYGGGAENDLSGDGVENDLSGGGAENDLSGGGAENDLSGGAENDLSGGGKNDLSGGAENDLSGGAENDLSGGGGEGKDGETEPAKKNTSNNTGTELPPNANPKKNITISSYKIPPLVFPTKKKIIRKYYKKLIVKLHPDKIDSENTVKFQKYFSECKKAKKLNCLYKCWLLSKKIGIKVKKTENITKAFLKEINILKVYIEERENSIINKWINSNNNDEKDLLIIQYITTFL